MLSITPLYILRDMRRNNRNYLFHTGELFQQLSAGLNSVRDAVGNIPRDQFLATSVDTLVEYIEQKFHIEPLVLHEDQMQMEHSETKIDVTGRIEYGSFDGSRVLTDGHKLRFFLPFSGNAELWNLRPNAWSSMVPEGEVDTLRRILTISFSNTSSTAPEWYKNELESTLQLIRQSISSQASMIKEHLSSVSRTARDAIAHRRQGIDSLQGLSSVFNIPVVKNLGMPEFKPLEIKRNSARALPRAPVSGYRPEPAINEELYEEILANIRHMGATFEGTPQTYQPMGEEGLRDILLASLNGLYRGNATGEAFRKYGKADIRIEEESRSAFVGECKLWGGERVLSDALDQLLSYLTWRDCKAALVLFNKSVAGFSGVQAKIESALSQHGLFLRVKSVMQPGEWRFVFKSKEDDGREVTVQIFCFNLFVSEERAGKKR
ncbi:hypothetical protein [Burkholderia plantarii]|uniref:Uncharacterized protein n=1 Tax=Burkholderia plantarii TaxID=41899 RepID=A0A0B6S7T8_BURPL|nr:hypothetical protein [Burkholderia plantarii]AJK49330.1 hypothetical protein BGL_2c12580 [Burkholderia plantarii]